MIRRIILSRGDAGAAARCEAATLTTTTVPALSDADRQRVLGLMKGADSVELKLTVPELALNQAGD